MWELFRAQNGQGGGGGRTGKFRDYPSFRLRLGQIHFREGLNVPIGMLVYS